MDSLIEQPALMSYFAKTTEDLVRFAIGIEDAVDIIADMEQALAA